MEFKQWLESWLYRKPKVDLRQDFDEMAKVEGGTLYRKGSIIQAWWTHDGRGQPFDQPAPETWEMPDEQQAIASFQRHIA
jgi:hypothetical protein